MLAPIPSEPRHRQAGFTLIEMLMVITVLAILMGMLMPMYNVVKRWTLKARTEHVIKKVDTALRLFKADFGVYPYVAQYPDDAQDLLAANANELFYRVGQDVDADTAGAIRRDMATAQAAFTYHWTTGLNIWGGDVLEAANQSTLSPLSFTADNSFVPYATYFKGETSSGAGLMYGYDPGNPSTAKSKVGVPTMLNRMAKERARLAILAGDVDLRGPIVCNTSVNGVTVDHTGSRLVTNPESGPANGKRPGWAKDYLAGDIERSFVRGDTILDGWKRPLVYVSQVTPGVAGDGGYVGRTLLMPFDSRFFGLGSAGFNPTTGPGPDLLASRPLLLTNGRVCLSKSDAGDHLGATPTSTDYFPDANDLMNSDIRYYAAPGYETEFELWSAGRDGKFSWRRGESQNGDNVAITPYTKGLR